MTIRRLALVLSLLAFPAMAQQATQPSSGAMQLLGRCTAESAQLIDRIAALEAELAKAKAELKKAPIDGPVPAEKPGEGNGH
jgi:uncharacterized small protein (DUF1192 family)